MKSTISPKHEFANRLAKYLMSFDDNKEVNARMRVEFGKKFHKTEYDYTSFLKYCAKTGDFQEQYLLGLSYARGFGCIKNYCRAMKWWTKAAEQGNKSSKS